MDTLQERRRLNEEIERAYIQTALWVQNILMYRQTERGIADIDLYTNFFNNFSFLVILTSDIPQMRESQDKVKAATDWMMEKFNADNDKALMARMEQGIQIFFDYKKILSDQGVVALPAR